MVRTSMDPSLDTSEHPREKLYDAYLRPGDDVLHYQHYGEQDGRIAAAEKNERSGIPPTSPDAANLLRKCGDIVVEYQS